VCKKETEQDITFIEMGKEIFYLSKNPLAWKEAKEYCENKGMVLAEPLDVLGLKKAITDNDHADYHSWLAGRGNGVAMVWDSSGDESFPHNHAFWEIEDGIRHPHDITTDSCLDMRPKNKDGPLASQDCDHTKYAICECF
ncbi:unnamed protein product, partial [Meganyctiphanes norvegica]